MALTKSGVVENIVDKTGFAKNASATAVESLLEIIKGSLEKGEDVMVSGFGKFSVKEKTERKGRNPATGGDMMLGARKVVTFKCSGKGKRSTGSRADGRRKKLKTGPLKSPAFNNIIEANAQVCRLNSASRLSNRRRPFQPVCSYRQFFV